MQHPIKSLLISAALCVFSVLCVAVPAVGQSQEDLTAYPKNIAAWDDATKQQQRDSGEKLIQDLVAAAKSGQKSFIIPKGDYRFQKTTAYGSRRIFILLRDLKDIVIDGSGSTFWFEDADQAIYIGGSRNVTLKNLFIDWDPLPYTQGTILNVNAQAKTLDFQVDEGYEKVSPRFAQMRPDQDEPNIRGAIFDPQTKLFKEKQNGFRVMPFLSQPQNNGRYGVQVLTFGGRDIESINARVGDRVAFWIRGEGAFLIENSENVTLEDVSLYSCAGFGFRDAGGKGPVIYRRCNISPRPGTNRLLGGNCDGFHSANMEIGPLIEGCDVRSLGDDGINIHGFFYSVIAQESPTVLITSPIAWRGDLENVTLDFLRQDNYAPLGRRLATTVKTIRYNGKDARRVELSEPITVKAGDMLSCENYVGNGAIIRNNSFRNIWPRGILYRSTDGKIENNRFEWIGSHAIALYPEPASWGESTYIKDLLVADNYVQDSSVFFGGNGRDDPSAGIYIYTPGFLQGNRQKNIEVRDNVIVRPGGDGISAQGVENLRITGNRISQVGNLTAGRAITTESVEGLVDKDNQIVGPQDSK